MFFCERFYVECWVFCQFAAFVCNLHVRARAHHAQTSRTHKLKQSAKNYDKAQLQ